jgi:hypothetical protein
MPKNKTTKSLVFNDENQLNSYGFRIPTKGIGLGRFKKNPVMLADHRNSLDSILGSFTDVKKSDGVLMGTPLFDSDNETTAEIERKYNSDFIKSCSMGITFNHEDMVFVEGVLVLNKCELMEVSLVAIPSNQNSLRLYAEGNENDPLTEDQVRQLCLSAQNVIDSEIIKNKNKNENMSKIKLNADVAVALGFDAKVTEVESSEVNAKVLALAANISNLNAKLTEATTKVTSLTQAAEQANLAAITLSVDEAVKAGKINADKKETFINLGVKDADLLATTLEAIPAKGSLSGRINNDNVDPSDVKSVDDFVALSTENQIAFKESNPEGYKQLFKS